MHKLRKQSAGVVPPSLFARQERSTPTPTAKPAPPSSRKEAARARAAALAKKAKASRDAKAATTDKVQSRAAPAPAPAPAPALGAVAAAIPQAAARSLPRAGPTAARLASGAPRAAEGTPRRAIRPGSGKRAQLGKAFFSPAAGKAVTGHAVARVSNPAAGEALTQPWPVPSHVVHRPAASSSAATAAIPPANNQADEEEPLFDGPVQWDIAVLDDTRGPGQERWLPGVARQYTEATGMVQAVGPDGELAEEEDFGSMFIGGFANGLEGSVPITTSHFRLLGLTAAAVAAAMTDGKGSAARRESVEAASMRAFARLRQRLAKLQVGQAGAEGEEPGSWSAEGAGAVAAQQQAEALRVRTAAQAETAAVLAAEEAARAEKLARSRAEAEARARVKTEARAAEDAKAAEAAKPRWARDKQKMAAAGEQVAHATAQTAVQDEADAATATAAVAAAAAAAAPPVAAAQEGPATPSPTSSLHIDDHAGDAAAAAELSAWQATAAAAAVVANAAPMPPSNSVRCRCCGRFVAMGALPEHSAHCFTVKSPVADDDALGKLSSVSAHRTPMWRTTPTTTPMGQTGEREGVTPSPQDSAVAAARNRVPPWAASTAGSADGSGMTPRGGGRRASIAGWGSVHAQSLARRPSPASSLSQKAQEGSGGKQGATDARLSLLKSSPRKRRMTISSVIDATQRERDAADSALAFMASVLEHADTYTKEFMSPDQYAEEVAEARSRRGSGASGGGGTAGAGPDTAASAPTITEMRELKAQLDAAMRSTSMSDATLERLALCESPPPSDSLEEMRGEADASIAARAKAAVAAGAAVQRAGEVAAEQERLQLRKLAAERQAAVDKAHAAVAASPALISGREAAKLREQSLAMLRAGVITAEE